MSQRLPERGLTARGAVFRFMRVLLLAYAGYLALLWFAQRRMVFPAHLVQTNDAMLDWVPGIERRWVKIDEGRVEAWVLPGDGATADAPGPGLIVAHGNAEVIDDWPLLAAAFQRLGFTVLLGEYRGYGRSDGSPTQNAITHDFERFHDLLATRPEVDASRIVYYGRSLGGGVVCALAKRKRPRALILTSTFRSLRHMARRYLSPPFLVRDPFDSERFLKSYDGPVYMVHGTQDLAVPYGHGVALAKAAQRVRFITYEQCGHDCPPDWEAFVADVAVWLREEGVLETPSQDASPAPPGPSSRPPGSDPSP